MASMTDHASKPDRPRRPNRKRVPLTVWVPAALRAAVETLAARTRRTLSSETILALERHLTEAGLWPPPPDITA